MIGSLAILLFALASAGAQANYKCPHDFGFYPHDVACDKYWACEGNVATLKTCGNGLAFATTDPDFLTENCDYYHNVDCSTRPERQAAIASPNCPYQYGIFFDDHDCTVFWSCWAGEGSRYQCGPGLAYDHKQRICTWIDKVPECGTQRAEAQADFVCPAPGALVQASSFTRHPHPEDCRQYYVCLDGIAREYGCPIGKVFQIGSADGHGQCTDPELVPGCEDYYAGLDLDLLQRAQALGQVRQGSQNPTPKSNRRVAPRPSRTQAQVQPGDVVYDDLTQPLQAQ